MENTKEKLQNLEYGLNKAANAWAEGANAGKPVAEMKLLSEAAKKAVNDFNAAQTEAVYAGWAAGENAVETAIRAAYIPGVKRVALKQDKKTGIFRATVDDARIKASLIDFQAQCGDHFFHDPKWCDHVQKLAYLVANAVDESLGRCEDFKYAIEQSAMLFEFSQNADPKSNRSMTIAIQSVVDDILYIPTTDKKGAEVNSLKVTSSEWAYIRECMTKQGKEIGEVIVGNYPKVAELVTDVINLILTEGKYMISSK